MARLAQFLIGAMAAVGLLYAYGTASSVPLSRYGVSTSACRDSRGGAFPAAATPALGLAARKARVDFYLGALANASSSSAPAPVPLSAYAGANRCGSNTLLLRASVPRELCPSLEAGKGWMTHGYFQELECILERARRSGACSWGQEALIHIGDTQQPSRVPTFSKVRPIAPPVRGWSVLLPLHRERHWGALEDPALAGDGAYGDKKDAAVWRGTPTGPKFCERWGDRYRMLDRFRAKNLTAVDVCLSRLVQCAADTRGPWDKWVCPALTLQQMLECVEALLLLLLREDYKPAACLLLLLLLPPCCYYYYELPLRIKVQVPDFGRGERRCDEPPVGAGEQLGRAHAPAVVRDVAHALEA